jgi:beta-phosphoglucomutase
LLNTVEEPIHESIVGYLAEKFMINTALFDYDGTLANTDIAHLACWNQTLEKYGAAIDTAFYTARCVGNDSYAIAEQIKKKFSTVSVSAGQLGDEKDSRYEQWIKTKTIALMPWVREMLVFLAEIKIKTGIVTGAPLAAIQKTLEDHQISGYFQTIVTRESVNKGKPAPDSYLFALHRLGTSPAEAVSFEDTGVGVLAAKAAGMTSFAIPGIFTASHDFSAADVVCKDMLEARAILAKLVRH